MIAGLLADHDELSDFYRGNGYRPIWRRESQAAAAAMALLADAGADGLDPARYGVGNLRALARQPARLAEFDVALSRTFTAFIRDLRTPPDAARMVYVDAELAPERRPSAILAKAGDAPSLVQYVHDARRMHPLYERLRAALAELRDGGKAPAGLAAARYERLLVANMDRLRALPADPGPRYALVDAASARLWMYENGKPSSTMRVAVGNRRSQTPALAGLIRFAVRNPYWNLPPDLTRERAAAVLRTGANMLARERLETLSGWEDDARVTDPSEVNWEKVVRGEQGLRMRQLPGPENMMGSVKFMLPNNLGIYLHDTPQKTVFARGDRRVSSGCVRLENATYFGDWLFGGQAPVGRGGAEERIDLPAPVPVYIVYLTAFPQGREIAIQDDPYDRDAELLAAARRAHKTPLSERMHRPSRAAG